MKKRFVAKNRVRIRIIKLLIILFVIVISFVLTFKFFYKKININIDNTKYIDYLVNDSFGSYSLGDVTSLSSIDFLLKYSFGIKKIDTGLVNKEVTSPIEPLEISKDPILYIYNTHQTESYKATFAESFNINNTVLLASYILKEYLSDLGIPTYVEENSIVDILNANGWKYGYSYKASRKLMEDAKNNNTSLNYFIDLHRDSGSYKATTATIDNVNYAKILFVIGLENEGYAHNLAMAENLNTKIKNINENLSRGIMKKEGKGVNGVYNQDFNPNIVLIEVGGQYNTIEEVNNTLKVLAKVIFDYIKETSYEKEET